MLRTTILLFMLLTVSIGLAQSPEPDRNALISESRAIIVGVMVEGPLPVIRRDKMVNGPTQQLPNGRVIVDLPVLEDYLVGRVFRLRVDEVLKKGGKIKVGDTVNVFISSSEPSEGAPALIKNQKFLLFLSSLKADDAAVTGATVRKPGRPAGEDTPFDPKAYYKIVGSGAGSTRITSQNAHIINEVRMALRPSH